MPKRQHSVDKVCCWGCGGQGGRLTGDVYSQRLKSKSCGSSRAFRRKERRNTQNDVRNGYAGLSLKLLAGWTCQDCVFQITEKYLSY